MNARRLPRRVSGSWSARKRISTSAAALATAVDAWLANRRSAWRLSRVGSSRSSGSSAQMTPVSEPSAPRIGISSQWWFQASGPVPLRAVS